jgi:hypothetical protein
MPPEPVLDERDRALLERLAARIVELRLETPAILALESTKPVTLLTSQAMVFLQPFAQALFRLPDYERLAALVERREAMEELVLAIERHAAARGGTRAGGTA